MGPTKLKPSKRLARGTRHLSTVACLLILWCDESEEDRARYSTPNPNGFQRPTESRCVEVRPLESRSMMRAPNTKANPRVLGASAARLRASGAEMIFHQCCKHCLPGQPSIPIGQTNRGWLPSVNVSASLITRGGPQLRRRAS